MANLPDALRVGTSSHDRPGVSFPEGPAPRKRSSVDRMTQLFPSRRESTVSAINESPRRESLPSPISIHTPTDYPSYDIPQAPAAPSFSSETAYDPYADMVSPITPSESPFRPARTRSILDRFGSVSNRLSRSSGYGKLGDEENDMDVRRSSKSKLAHVQEEDGEHYGFDVSGFDGPFPLHHMAPAPPAPIMEDLVKPSDGVEASLAAEYDRLEAQGAVQQPYGLGGGMRSVVHASPSAPGHKRARSGASVNQAVAQQHADWKGEIVAVSEIPTMDISLAEGTEWEESGSLRNAGEGEVQTSYYFPEDKNKPSWRPFSMKWPYLTILILLALALGVLQEFLCQVSLRRENGILSFKNAQDISVGDYFAWKYAPTMILVTYGVMWQITDFEVKRLEPYFQLSHSSGATAAESLNIDYLTSSGYMTPLKAIKYRQWAVLFSSVATLLAGSLAPVLQSASVKLYPERNARGPDVEKMVKMVSIWSRLLSATLFLVAMSGTYLLFQLQRRKSGLLCDPKGIAGIAAMATTSHILQDFEGLDRADEATIHKQLKHRRYVLNKSSIWQGKYIGQLHKRNEQKVSRNPQLAMLTLKAGIPYILYIIGVAAVTPVFLFFQPASIVPEKIPFLLTALATCIKVGWNTLDNDIRLVEPYYILSQRRAPPQTLTLDYTGTPPGWIVVKAALNKHYVVASVGLGAVMTEVLTVCMSSFTLDAQHFLADMADRFKDHRDAPDDDDSRSSNNTDETFTSFWASLILSNVILVALCAIALTTYARRRHKFCPRPPGTIASVLAYIHRSNMLSSFVDTQQMDSGQMTAHLLKQEKSYGLGWFRSRLDGQDHCGVDEEPLLASYKYGEDWDKGRMTGPMVDAF